MGGLSDYHWHQYLLKLFLGYKLGPVFRVCSAYQEPEGRCNMINTQKCVLYERLELYRR